MPVTAMQMQTNTKELSWNHLNLFTAYSSIRSKMLGLKNWVFVCLFGFLSI